MEGMINGMKLFIKFRSSTKSMKPSAVTWVGIIMTARMKVAINFFSLKSYT